MHIRPETASDHDAIHHLTDAAFTPMAFSDGTEAQAIRDLRRDGDLALSLVAEADGDIVGHVAFSPARIADRQTDWYGLGPIAVRPALQRQGIGTALIARGLDEMKARHAAGVCLIGNPDIYLRAGLQNEGALTYGDLAPHLVHWVAFRGSAPKGEITFAPALQDV